MIRVENLSIKNQDTTLIAHLSLTFRTGEFWAVLGKNGTGKTTLLHTLAGFNPYQGSIKINNQELRSFNVRARAQNVSLLPQMLEASLNCSVKQAISYGRYPWHSTLQEKNQDDEMINFAIKSMGLQNLKHKSILQLSGGELRKVEIATILAQNSQIMLLDEPLNHLDLSYKFKFMQLLKQLSKNKTIIMVTHDIQYVQEYCSHVILLCDNTKIKVGTVNAIMNKENLNKMLEITL